MTATGSPKRIRVKFSQEGSDWLVEDLDEPRIHSFGRTVSKARANIIDAAALWYEIDPEAVDVAPVFAFGDDLPRILAQLNEARVEYSEVEDHVRALTDAAVAELLRRRVSMRDAAEILGLSHQRIQQIAARSAAGVATSTRGASQ
jgi:predicted RNase H-like HicB family nuclease